MKKLEVKGKLTDKIKSLSKESAEDSSSLLLWFIGQTWLFGWAFQWIGPINTELLKQVIFKKKNVGQLLSFLTMSWLTSNFDDVSWFEMVVVLHGPVRMSRNPIQKNARLFVSSERSREELESLPHAQVNLTKQGSWVILDGRVLEEYFPILTQGQYIATFDQQAPTIDEIFKLDQGRSMKYVGCNEETYLRHQVVGSSLWWFHHSCFIGLSGNWLSSEALLWLRVAR